MKKMHIFFCFLSVILVGFNLLIQIDIERSERWIIIAITLSLVFQIEEDGPVATTLSCLFACITWLGIMVVSFREPLRFIENFFYAALFVLGAHLLLGYSSFRKLLDSTPKIGVQESGQ
jgi:hypothetical protein